MLDDVTLLHVYGPRWHHDEAYLVGNHRALLSLRAAIAQALSPAGQGTCEAMVADGEGFDLIILRDDTPWHEGWQRRALPYTNDSAQGRNPDALWPWQTLPGPSPPGRDASAAPPQKPAIDPHADSG